jgi:hypothetical protein
MTTNTNDDLSCFRGLMFALPLGLLCWVLIILAVKWGMK